MTPVLGISVAKNVMHAVVVQSGRIQWSGTASYENVADATEVLARLAGEAGVPIRRARIALEREVVQLRSITPPSRLPRQALQRYIALEAPRLFRRNGADLVTDATLMVTPEGERTLWAGAVAEPLILALTKGCEQAGLILETVGPAADVLPFVVVGSSEPFLLVVPHSNACEHIEYGPRGTWRSRLVLAHRTAPVPWVPELARFGDSASQFAAAYAITRKRPRLELLPRDYKHAWTQRSRRRLTMFASIAVLLWIVAVAVRIVRLELEARRAESELWQNRAAIDSTLALRRDLGTASRALGIIKQFEISRSRLLPLLSDLSRTLSDSVFLVAIHLNGDGTLRLGGYAPSAARALADLERVSGILTPTLEGGVTRELAGGIAPELDRFSIASKLVARK